MTLSSTTINNKFNPSKLLQLSSLMLALLTSGFAFMILEIIFLRELLITLGGAVYASSAMLASVMSGLFLGSQFFGFLTTKTKKIDRLFVLMELLLSLCSCVLIPIIRYLGNIENWSWRYFLSFLIILIPSALVGGEIPVAMQYIEQNIEKGRAGLYTGLVYGADTLGALIGALILPFFLLPNLGAYHSSLIAALGDFISGFIVAFWAISNRRNLLLQGIMLLTLAGSAVALWSNTIDHKSAAWSLKYRYKYLKKPYLLSYQFKDSAYQRIHLANINFQPDHHSTQKIKMLYLDGLAQTSNSTTRTYHEIIYFPLLSHPNPKELLFIGCGDGDLIASALRDPRIEHIDHVDIDSEVTSIARREIPEVNHIDSRSVWDNPKVSLYNVDGRQFIRSSQKKYDIIFSDLPDAMQEGSGAFYSLEFIKQIHAHLNINGIFATHDYISPEVSSNWRLQLSSLLLAARTAAEIFGQNQIHLMSPKLWPQLAESDDAADTTFLLAFKNPLQISSEDLQKRFSHLSQKPLWFSPQRFWRWIGNAYIPEGFDKFPITTDDKPLILYPQAWTDSEAISYIERHYY